MKKTILRKTASSALAFMMTFSSASAVTAINFSNISAKTVKKASKKTTKKTTKKSVKKTKKTSSKKTVKKPSVYMTPLSKTLYVKSSAYIYLKNNKSSVKWLSSNTKVSLSKKTRSSVKVYAKSAGVSYVTAYIGKKKYTCKVTVKNKSASTKNNRNTSNSATEKTDNSIKVTPEKRNYKMFYNWTDGSKSLAEKGPDGSENDPEVVGVVLNKKANVKWQSSNKNILKIGKTTTPDLYDDELGYYADIEFVNFGTADVYAYVNGKKYTMTVSLKPSAVYNIAKKAINDLIKPNMDDAHKAYAIAKWMAMNSKYDPSYISKADTLENILIDHRGVCRDYADTFDFFMNKLNIKSRIIVNNIENHAFNQICINGKWANIDLAYMGTGISPENFDFCFFLKSDKYIANNYKVDHVHDVSHRVDKTMTATNTDYDNYNWEKE